MAYSVKGPWPTGYQFASWECTVCKTPINGAAPDHDKENGVAWNAWSERMAEGEDYHVVMRTNGPRLDGTRPLVATWMFNPMIVDDVWVGRMVDQARRDSAEQSHDAAAVLLLPGDIEVGPWRPAMEAMFSEVWALSPAMLLGAAGPYPSVRAERSIVTTLSPIGLRQVRHYWPAARLAARDYVPLASHEELTKAWSAHARRQIRTFPPKDTV